MLLNDVGAGDLYTCEDRERVVIREPIVQMRAVSMRQYEFATNAL